MHLTAQNEYREHFPLTRIPCAVEEGIGFECSLPGAHSDIGGGYSEDYPENKVIKPSNPFGDYIDFEWFITKGYYFQHQTNPPVPGQRIYGKRNTKFHYQFICFEIMKDISSQQCKYKIVDQYSKIPYRAMKRLREHLDYMKQEDILGTYFMSCYSYILSKYRNVGLDFRVPNSSNENMRYIYNHYIHNSIDYGDKANEAGTSFKDASKGGEPKRTLVTDGYKYGNLS